MPPISKAHGISSTSHTAGYESHRITIQPIVCSLKPNLAFHRFSMEFFLEKTDWRYLISRDCILSPKYIKHFADADFTNFMIESAIADEMFGRFAGIVKLLTTVLYMGFSWWTGHVCRPIFNHKKYHTGRELSMGTPDFFVAYVRTAPVVRISGTYIREIDSHYWFSDREYILLCNTIWLFQTAMLCCAILNSKW